MESCRCSHVFAENAVGIEYSGFNVERQRERETNVVADGSRDKRDQLTEGEQQYGVEPVFSKIKVEEVPGAAPVTHDEPAIDVEEETRGEPVCYNVAVGDTGEH